MCWSYAENQAIPFDPTTVVFKPTGSFYPDMAAYCELAGIKLHPSFRECKPVKNLYIISVGGQSAGTGGFGKGKPGKV